VRLADGTRLKADIVLFNGDPKACSTAFLGDAATEAVQEKAVARAACRPLSGVSRPSHGVSTLPITTSFSAPIPKVTNSATSQRADATRCDALRLRAGPGGAKGPKGIERFEIIMNGPGTPGLGRGTTDMPDTHFRDLGEDGADVLSGPGRQTPDHAPGFRHSLSRVGRFPLRAEPAWDDGDIPSTGRANEGPGALPLRGRHASGGGNSHGLPLRQARGRGDLERPCFDIDVPPDGYAWWYVDGISDDGARAISIIGFIGSVFSPGIDGAGGKTRPTTAA
jgi:hypothetical protein